MNKISAVFKKMPNDLSLEQKEIIKEILINIFKDIWLNSPNVLKAKSESDKISEEIRKFILNYASFQKNTNEINLFDEAKEKGIELVENYELIFEEKKIDKKLKMRAFLIPGIKVESSEDNDEEITEDDMQSVDHELCISFRTKLANEFVNFGNLIDIRATLAKSFSGINKDTDVLKTISDNQAFQKCLEDSYFFAGKTIN